MCSRVVLPALSRPRKSSFACLFRSPKDASVSQTVKKINISPLATQVHLLFSKVPDSTLTPVDNPHVGQLCIRYRFGINVSKKVVGG